MGVNAGICLVSRLIPLGCGFALQRKSGVFRDLATPGKCGVVSTANSTEGGLEECPDGIRYRQLADLAHGGWHFLSSIAICGMVMMAIEGLSGSYECSVGFTNGIISSHDDNQREELT